MVHVCSLNQFSQTRAASMLSSIGNMLNGFHFGFLFWNYYRIRAFMPPYHPAFMLACTVCYGFFCISNVHKLCSLKENNNALEALKIEMWRRTPETFRNARNAEIQNWVESWNSDRGATVLQFQEEGEEIKMFCWAIHWVILFCVGVAALISTAKNTFTNIARFAIQHYILLCSVPEK